MAERIHALASHRLYVAIDGYTAAWKTTFGHELAAEIRRLGRPTLRACLDDFKHPRSEAHLYDRLTGEGYFGNGYGYDFDAARRFLLEQAGSEGTDDVVLARIDPLTQENHQGRVVHALENAVLVVDLVFAFRPEDDEYWDFRTWLDIDPALRTTP